MLRTLDVGSPEFSAELGMLLRQARGGRRRRNFARAPLSTRELRAAERGRLPLTPQLVNALAERYGVDLDELLPGRTPVSISANGTVAAGGRVEAFAVGDEGSLLNAYIRLVRRLRGVEPGVPVVVRALDLAEIANEIGQPYVYVLNALAERMEIDEDDRLAMADMLVSGAEVVGVV